MAKLKDLAPNPRNPRKISKERLDMLKKSLTEFGDLSGIVFNRRTQQLVGGHQRQKALPPDAEIEITKLYSEPTPAGTVADGYAIIDGEHFKYREVDWDELKEKQANLAANKHGGEWDLPQLSEWLLELDHHNVDWDVVGFTNEDLEKFIVPVEKVLPGSGSEDSVPIAPKIATTKPGDVWVMGEHRLLCGDSTNVEHVQKLFGEAKAEVCFTSPPYADQREYNGGKELSTEHLAKFISTAFSMCAYFVVNLGYSRKEGEVNEYWDDYIAEARACGLRFLSWNIWDKGECGSVGNQTAMFGIRHEWIFVFGPKSKDLFPTVPNNNGGVLADHTTIRQKDGSLKSKAANVVRDCRQLDTILNCSPQKARNHDIEHPAMFPSAFAEAYIEAMTRGGQTIYEPFGGSGTTLVAAEKLGRRALVMELDPIYCDVIVTRWERFTGRKAELIENLG